MARPQHLSVPNTPEGIRRINELQAAYDRDPAAYEAAERHHEEMRQQEEEAQRVEYEASMAAQAEAAYEAQMQEEISQ